jgi:hypothetical protein
MRERASSIGGTLTLRAVPGSGTALEVASHLSDAGSKSLRERADAFTEFVGAVDREVAVEPERTDAIQSSEFSRMDPRAVAALATAGGSTSLPSCSCSSRVTPDDRPRRAEREARPVPRDSPSNAAREPPCQGMNSSAWHEALTRRA